VLFGAERKKRRSWQAAGIAFEIVPGHHVGDRGPAYAGIQ